MNKRRVNEVSYSQYVAMIRRSLDYIERHMTQRITLKELSKQAVFSNAQFYRIFNSMVGFTVADYTRRRRLTRAALDLIHTDKRILDIAFEYRFQSQEAFTRAFKKLFTMTPGEYRKYSTTLIHEGGTQMFMKSVPQGWTVTGQNPEAYEVATDRKVVHHGRAAGRLRSKNGDNQGFVTLMQMFNAQEYRSKRLKCTAFIKSDQVCGWAGLWMRVDHENGDMLRFDNMQSRPIQGTLDWNQYEVILDIPADSGAIAFGILLSGGGSVWVDGFRFDIVDERVPTTDSKAEEALPLHPMNLDFEA
ncbi:helix-turn-helix transcriptional regulator [Paenibacillus mendelii]|uniref:Helix-turn-helix transcriptional regulator n=1 Tax=Paenibacillus mendelii TaxID=206163 RepID=A0ABV6JE46_9BACL|nr:AraC family transcriptional regulator [Paenibacillus mendelii]MCQ6562414.1 AraC family transcriptional regulator [Paenibacillus mendelii]